MTSQQPHNERDSPSGILDDLSTPISPDKPLGPTLGTRLIIFSALVLPSALIPLLVLRRSVNGLHRKIDELGEATRGLHHEFKAVASELSIRREHHQKLQAMITETRVGLAQLRGEAQRLRTDHTNKDERLRNQLEDLVASNQYVATLIISGVARGGHLTRTYPVAYSHRYDAGSRLRVYGSWGRLLPTSLRSCKRLNFSRGSSRLDSMAGASNAFGFLPCNLRRWVG